MQAVTPLHLSAQPSRSGWIAGRPGDAATFPLLCGLLLWAACFFNTVDLNYGHTAAEDQVGLDWQVAVKLVIAAACCGFGLLAMVFSPRAQAVLTLMPGCVLFTLGVVFVLTSAFALPQAATVSRVAAIVNLGYLCFAASVLSLLGMRKTTLIVLAALVCHLIVNWILYLLVPELGVFREELQGNVIAQRMGGLGHPNAIARIAVIAIVLAISIIHRPAAEPHPVLDAGPTPGRSRVVQRSLLISVVVLGVLTMLATYSRTAIVAGSVATGLLLADKWLTRRGVLSTLTVIAALIFLVSSLELYSGGGFFSDSFLSATTKTGDVEELTSATGRTEIWAEAIRLISQKPITGYGLNSAPFLLQDFSLHPHNLVLHALISGGLIAGLLVMVLVVWMIAVGLSSPEPLVRAISMFVLVSGIFEDTVLDTFASPLTLLWLLTLMHPAWVAVTGRGHNPAASESRVPVTTTGNNDR